MRIPPIAAVLAAVLLACGLTYAVISTRTAKAPDPPSAVLLAELEGANRPRAAAQPELPQPMGSPGSNGALPGPQPSRTPVTGEARTGPPLSRVPDTGEEPIGSQPLRQQDMNGALAGSPSRLPGPKGASAGLLSAQTPNGGELHLVRYRQGDSPVDANGVFEWTKPGASRDWSRMPMSSNPETESNSEYVWFTGRATVPPGNNPVHDPYLAFTQASYAFEVYSGSELIFRYGDMEGDIHAMHTVKPVFVSLEGHEFEPLLLRIHSKRGNALHGKIGPVLYGSQSDLKLELIRKDALDGIVLLVFFMIGFVALLMYFINRDNMADLYFALFSLTISCSQLLSLKSPLLFADYSAIPLYLEEPLSGCMVYLFALYFIHILNPAYGRLVAAAGRAMLAAGLIMPVVKLLVPGLMEKYSSEIADVKKIGFSLLCALCLIIILLSLGKRSGSDARWFVSGFSFYLIVNMVGNPLRLYVENYPGNRTLAPLEFVQILRVCVDCSLLFSMFFFGVISYRRYAEVYRATRSYNLQLANWNHKLEWEVNERTGAIQNLLDHAGQGFLTIDERLEVQKETSIECRRLFGREIEGAGYARLLHPHDAEEQAFHEEILQSVFHGDDLQKEVYLSLLPMEAEIGGKRVALQYKWIPGFEASCGKVMVILTDTTEQRKLECQMDKERRTLNMVVWVIRHYRDFRELMMEYREFAGQGMDELMRAGHSTADIGSELARAVHTFKGNFAQIDFVHTAEKLHEFETRLGEWRQRLAVIPSDPADLPRFMRWIGQSDWLGWLEEDLRFLRELLGEQFDTGQEVVAVELERLRHLERQAMAILPEPEAAVIVAELKKLRYRPFRELLAAYPEYAAKLAASSGKEIYPVSITGGELLVDSDLYSEFTRTLIHVFRNMIDHGIETPEERASVGKDRRGTVQCELSDDEQEIRLRLSNNGRIMDLVTIGRLAVDKGIVTSDEMNAMSADERRMLIFHEGFTTKDTVSGLSGRGVGLCAVHKSLESLNGKVRVESGTGHGTTFYFAIPRMERGRGQAI